MTRPNALPGIPPNMSIMAAISAGLLPANAQITNFGNLGRPGGTILADLANGDSSGNGLVPSDLPANAAASAITTATPVGYGGD